MPRSFFVSALYSFILIAAVVFVGTVMMHVIEGWSYLDSFLLYKDHRDGTGTPANLDPQTSVGKVFSSVLAFISVGTLVTALLSLSGPFLGGFLQAGVGRVEEVERDIEGKKRPFRQ